MTIPQALDWRYAVQTFDSSKIISDEDRALLLETLRKAPSSMNFQPWKFIRVTDSEIRQKLKEAGYGQTKITDASDLIVVAHKTNITKADSDKVIRETAKQRGLKESDLEGYRQMTEGFATSNSQEMYFEWARRQTYIAIGFLMLAAAQMRIDAAPMEGFDTSKVNDILGLEKNGYSVTSMVALGYRSSDDPYADYKKVRFAPDEVIETV